MKAHILLRCLISMLFLFSGSLYADIETSPFSLEIIQPRQGLNENNRFYRAYPGLEFKVPVSVIGGAYPYTYELTGPSGASIGGDGVLTWSNPVEQSTAVPFSVTVTDSLGSRVTVNWTVKVTKTNFMFVDAVNGVSGAAGTIDAPARSIADVYGGTEYTAKWSPKNQNKFVYFKNGTYVPDGYTGGTAGVQWTLNQPAVLMAYPGHTPRIDMTSRFFFFDTATHNLYVEGFNVTPISGSGGERFGFRVVGNSNNVTFWRNSFTNLTASTGSNNQSAIMATRVSASEAGKYWAIKNNTFKDIYHGYGIIGYSVDTLLFEKNTLSNFTDPTGESSLPIGPKIDTTKWIIRANTLENVNRHGIWIYYESVEKTYGNIEVCYNLVKATGGQALSVNDSYATTGTGVYVYRNTFIGGNVRFSGLTNSTGPIRFWNNVVVNSSGTGATCVSCSSSSALVQIENLVGSSSSAMVDTNGLLAGNYVSYKGSVGHEIVSQTLSPPVSPTLTVSPQ